VIRVVIVDDHAIVRAGIRALFSCEPDVEVVGEAGDGPGALSQVERTSPDVLLADLSIPALSGVEIIARARALNPRMRVLVLSMHTAAEYVRPALRAGANGYVVKGSGLEDLVKALRLVAAGERFLDPRVEAVARVDEPASATRDDLERLTSREREVLQLVAEGQTNRQIAERLGLSPKTVDAHRTNLMRKLDLHDAQALTRFALRRGMIQHE
jgi:DNA-binding NarL/FixJ family response regulator